MLAEFVHVDQRLLRRARGADHGIDQRGQAIGLADDDAGVFTQVFVQLALQQLRGAAQAAQRILDLVRQLPNHLPAGVEARHQFVLARDALALRGVGDLEQQIAPLELAVERRHGDVDDAMLAAERTGHHGHLAFGEGLAGLERAAHQRRQRIGFEHQRKKRLAARLVDAHGEQILRGDVGVHHAQVGIEYDDAGCQRADEVGGLEMGDRRGKESLNRHAGLRPRWQ